MTSESPPESLAPGAREVARYFDELEALASARYWDDPETLALSIVQELAGGGTSHIDRLGRLQAEVEAKVRGLSVPVPCQEHHRRTLALFGSAGELLQEIGRSASAGDLAGVTAVASQAQRLEAEATQLRELENALRSRYGLPPATS